MEKQSGTKETLAELFDSLGTVGTFMLGEVRAALKKGVATREEFFATLDRTARIMKQSGKMAAEDVERAAQKIRDSWELIDAQGKEDWDKFLSEVKSRMTTLGDVTQETFNLAVDFGTKRLRDTWESTGKLGEEQMKFMEKHAEEMSGFIRSNWGVFSEHFRDAGDRAARAFDAAWEELNKEKKKD
ncbi:MAG: hypothetical protein AB1646_10840 [Thermodesulfobacteriota bacterium]